MVIRRDWKKSRSVRFVIQGSTVGSNMQTTTQVTVQLVTGVLMVWTDLIPLEIIYQRTMQVTTTPVHTMMAGKQVMEAYVQLVTTVRKDPKHHSFVPLAPMVLSQSLLSV